MKVQSGSADLCFIIQDDILDVQKRLVANDVAIVDLSPEETDNGTVLRIGARGSLRSIYCRDPDGNLIELSNYLDQ